MTIITADLEYALFRKKVLDLVGIDLASYKPAQMRRRLNGLMVRNGVSNLLELYRLVAGNPAKKREFVDFLTINVSEFFRIPNRFEYLRTKVVPELLTGRRRLTIWSAGCSNGSEPYSLAIMMREIFPAGRWRILATDLDRSVLEKARAGAFLAADIQNVDDDRSARYFKFDGDKYYISQAIKTRVEFQAHDLLRDEYPQDVDLIVCRHVVIYFAERAKDDIYRGFARSLRPGGFLFLGGTEVMHRPAEFGFEMDSTSFYRRLAVPHRLATEEN